MCFSDEFAMVSNTASIVPYYVFLTLSLVILLSPVDPAKATQDFTIYRLTHYDILDSAIGSRSAQLTCDFQTISTRNYARRCVIMKLVESGMENIRSAVNNNAGGIIIILPVNGWTEDLYSQWLVLESELLTESLQIPVYFTTSNDEVEAMYSNLQKLSYEADKSGGPSLFDSIFSVSYRAFTTAQNAIAMKNAELINIEGKLTSSKFDAKKPSIVLSAYYDAGGAVPSLAYGADANAAGVAVLLEAARMLSQFAGAKNLPKYNIVFLLTGGGKYNFLGAKRWLEMNLEDTAGLALLDSVVQVISLEGLGTNLDNILRLHVSRMPKVGTFSQRLVLAFETAAKLHPPSNDTATVASPVEVVHKKINLNQYDLAWEHERFSLHRLSTATLSAWPTSTSYKYRNSTLDGGPLYGRKPGSASRGFWGPVKANVVARNTRVLTEALAHLIYDMDSDSAANFSFVDPAWCTENSVAGLLDLLTLRPRSSQLLIPPPPTTSSIHSRQQPASPPTLISSLEQYMRTSHLSDVRLTRHQFARLKPATTAQQTQNPDDSSNYSGAKKDMEKNPDQVVSSMSAASKDPEVTFYSSVSPTKITIYRLKSSVFDLFVACFIGAYLYVIYFLMEHFGTFLDLATRMATDSEKKLKSF